MPQAPVDRPPLAAVPLNGLRAFEAALRLGGFSAAGLALNVSPAAVSRLVKLLEGRLGTALFTRRANRLEPTLAGARLGKRLEAAFTDIAEALAEARRPMGAPHLVVGLGPTFAMRWLIPRLGSFQRDHPDIEIRLATALPGGAPLREDWDVAIRPGSGHWPGLEAIPLVRAVSFPVAAPGIAARLATPLDLAGEVLLRVAGADGDWRDWLALSGARALSPRGPVFDNAAQAIQAALDGQGVVMARAPFVADDLAAGRLVRPFAIAIDHDRAWYAIHRPPAPQAVAAPHAVAPPGPPGGVIDNNPVVVFVNWLRAQIPSGGAEQFWSVECARFPL